MAGLSYLQRLFFTTIFTLPLLITANALAEDVTITYKVSPAYALTSIAPKNTQWLAPQSLSNASAFIANEKGQFFQVIDQTPNASPFLDLNALFSKNKQLKLTSFTLHPNFSQRDATGEGILYTAHIEYVLGESPTFLSDDATPKNFPINYHAVVTEWQLNTEDQEHYQYNNQPREILRIALTDSHKGITQLGFNPYLKAWNEDFGLLHLVLPVDTSLAQVPLYSGSVLRINPARFALKHYTVPSNNPFLKKHKILNEAIVVGASNIQKINWTKHDEKKIIISHISSETAQVSYTSIGSDGVQKALTNVLWQQEGYQDSLSGRVFTLNKLEFFSLLHKVKGLWNISTLRLSQLNQNASVESWEITSQLANAQDELTLNGQSLYNASTEKVMLLTPLKELTANIEELATQSSIEWAVIVYFIIIIIILLVMLGIVYWAYRHYNGTNIKPILRQSFSHFEYTQAAISLYSRGSPTPAEILNIKNITCCEVLLNDRPILLLNNEMTFDDELKDILLQAFNLEQQHKMTKHKVRKIMLVLTAADKKSYAICLYLRKGDQRYTKINYQLTQTKLIDWAQLYTSIWAS